MKMSKYQLQQIIQEELKHIREEEKMPTDWDMVEELDQLISRLQRIREVLHVKSGVFEGKNQKTKK